MSLSREEEERASAIHRKATVVDTHNDTILDLMKGDAPSYTSKTPTPYREFSLQRRLGVRSDKGHIDIPRIREGGVDCLFFAMYVSPMFRGRLRRLMQMLDVFYSELEENRDRIVLATTFDDVIDAKKNGKIAAILTVEGGEPLEEDAGPCASCTGSGSDPLPSRTFRGTSLPTGPVRILVPTSQTLAPRSWRR